MRRALLALVAVAACGDNNPHGPGPHVAFEVGGDPVAIAGVPFPNDLYLDESGQLEVPVAAMPFTVGADPEILGNVSAAFAELDCFGPGGGVVFPLRDVPEAESIDEATLSDENVLLIDLASGARLPTEHHVRSIEKQIFVRPRRGTVLATGTTYAAVLTTGVALTSGDHLAASFELEDALAGASSSAAANRAYAPLAAAGPAPEDIAGAAVFTTCDYDADFAAILDHFDQAEPAVFTPTQVWRAAELDALLGTPADDRFPGVDNPGGIAHADIGFVVAGTFMAPNYQSATPGRLGIWERDGAGAPVVKGADQVPVLLVVPAGLTSHADLPVVLFQHGLGESKTALFALGNTLAARGIASISIDIPFHGGRYPEARDIRHNFGDSEGPDGLADPTGILAAPYFFDLFGDGDAAAPLDPRVQTASFRQAAIDVIALTRLIDGGDWSALAAMTPALDDLSFRTDRMVYASESFGGFIGLLAIAYEPRLQAAFLSVAGGGLLGELLENSPTYAPFFMPILNGAFDVAPNEVDPLYDPAHSHWAYQMMGLLLGSADPLTYAPRLRDKGVHVVLAAAFSDESVPNQSGEALAGALGLPWAEVPGAADVGPRYLDSIERVELPVADGRAFFELDPASHGMLTRGQGERKFAVGFPPFDALSEPDEFANPIVALQAYLAEFAVTYVTDGTPVLARELSVKKP